MKYKIYMIFLLTIFFVSCDDSFDTSSPFEYENSKIEGKCFKDSDCDSDNICDIKNRSCIGSPCNEKICGGDCLVHNRADDLDSSNYLKPYCVCDKDSQCTEGFICNRSIRSCVPSPCNDRCDNGICKVIDFEIYECSCNDGYYLSNDKRECNNPCTDIDCGEGRCIAENYKNFHCDCNSNYFDNNDNNLNNRKCVTPCIDIACGNDENMGNGICIADSLTSYHCKCNNQNNFFKTEDGLNCITPCDGVSCNEPFGKCIAQNSSDFICDCQNSGYRGRYCNENIDESRSAYICPTNSYCIDKDPRDDGVKYICECDSSEEYREVKDNNGKLIACLDSNSCISSNECDENATCESNYCKCKDGYSGDGLNCKNIYFITKWKTEFENNENVITIPTYIDYEYYYDIDCSYNKDDGFIADSVGEKFNYNCVYDTPGNYTIAIRGVFPYIHFKDNANILSVEMWGTQKWKSMRSSFESCSNITISALDTPDLSEVKDMSRMFKKSSLSIIEAPYKSLNDWDVSNVVNMDAIFREASSFNEPLSSWNVSNVVNMKDLFYGTAFNQDISSWDVSNVTNMSGMFSETIFDQEISSWNISSVVDMDFMFSNSSFDQDINDWDVSNVQMMRGLFFESKFNLPLNRWNVSNVTNMSYMFTGSSFNQNISTNICGENICWDVSNVTDMNEMFKDAVNFNQDLSSWSVENVNICYQFYNQAVWILAKPNFINCQPEE